MGRRWGGALDMGSPLEASSGSAPDRTSMKLTLRIQQLRLAAEDMQA